MRRIVIAAVIFAQAAGGVAAQAQGWFFGMTGTGPTTTGAGSFSHVPLVPCTVGPYDFTDGCGTMGYMVLTP